VWCEAKQVRRRNDDTLCSGNNGTKAREEVTKVLRRFGCESIGFMDDFEKHEVLLAFTHRGRQVQLHASAKGWAQMYLKENPWTYNRRSQRVEYEQAALRQGHIAVNSVLRDSRGRSPPSSAASSALNHIHALYAHQRRPPATT
jgi:hypothetical protein